VVAVVAVAAQRQRQPAAVAGKVVEGAFDGSGSVAV
jgi:hypothetical protein